MSDTNFQPIFEHIDQMKEEIIGEILGKVASKESIEHLQVSVDSFAKKEKDRSDELVVLNGKTKRIENWIIQAAKKTKVPYNP